MTPAVLALIVAYNSAAVLPACVASLRAQEGVRMRIVVVDNGSSDLSAEVAERAGGGVHVVRAGENLGFAKGCNRAWQEGLAAGQADGFTPEFVLYFNPDARMEGPRLLAEMAQLMAARPQAAIATPRLVREDGSLDLACRRRFPSLWDGFCRATGLAAWPLPKRWVGGYNLLDRDPLGDYAVPCVTGAFMMCRAEFVQAVGGFDERYFMYVEDVDLCWQAAARGREVWYFGSLSARHSKGHASQGVSDAMLAALFCSTRQWYEKNRYGQMNGVSRGLTRLGLWLWEKTARLKNRLRQRKSAQP